MPESEFQTILIYVGFATAYAIAGYTSNVLESDGDDFKMSKAGKTVLIGVVTGIIMAIQGFDATPEAYTAAAVIAIPIVDQLWNSFSRTVRGAQKDDTSG